MVENWNLLLFQLSIYLLYKNEACQDTETLALDNVWLESPWWY